MYFNLSPHHFTAIGAESLHKSKDRCFVPFRRTYPSHAIALSNASQALRLQFAIPNEKFEELQMVDFEAVVIVQLDVDGEA